MSNKKIIFKFILILFLSFIFIEGIEIVLNKLFNIDLHNLKYGWIGIILFFGFKYHIFCCLIPVLWASYKCKHKCKHDYCQKK
jgi:hypothetical protein